MLGIATGIIPCPTLIAAYLTGIASGNFLLGIQSILIFSVGMFISLMALIIVVSIGGATALQKAKNGGSGFFSRLSDRWQLIQGSALCIIGLIVILSH